MGRFLRWLWRVPAILLALLVLVGIAGFFWLRTSLPDYDGSVTVAGLDAEVEIVRDANAVPHIFAQSDTDAAFAIGFVHAQDRLAQMEIMRRIGQGRMAELAGEAALPIDRFMRTLGLYRRAQESFYALSPEMRRGIEAYAAGVNAYIDRHEGAWPPEYYLFGAEPEPWKPADTLVWSRIMALGLAVNWRSEAMRARFVRALGRDKTLDLWPAYPEDAPITVEDAQEVAAAFQSLPLDALAEALPWDMVSVGASNQWVVSGEHSASGRPLLANDPHLSLRAPAIWYLARIDVAGDTVVGATAPGVPLVVLGHNGDVAWGFATSYIDTDDLFIERISSGDPEFYDGPDGPLPFRHREEVIEVRFGDPVTLDVRETRHGPVIDDVLNQRRGDDEDTDGMPPVIDEGYVLALSAPWLRERDRTAEALFRMNRAGNVGAFVDALELFEAPPQNIVFADTAGRYGFYTPGLIPKRPLGGGFLPTPGWSGAYDWDGFIPFEELPHAIEPRRGIIVNANNKLVGPDYPYELSEEWGGHHRAERIEDMLADGAPFTPGAFVAMQSDMVSLAARDTLPLLRGAELEDLRAIRARELLGAWDWRMERDRAEPLIWAAWLRALNRRLYADELDALLDSYWGFRAEIVTHMTHDAPAWCDDTATEARETCPEQAAAALIDALDWIEARHGADMSEWRWGDEHYADLSNRTFDILPLIRRFTNLRLPADGGAYTVNRADFNVRDEDAPFADRHGAGYRAVYDLADLADTRFVIAGGQSGNPFSGWYDTLFERWRDGEYIRIAGSREAVAAGAIGTLNLVPGAP